jgi:hypothetical protein
MKKLPLLLIIIFYLIHTSCTK